jgi:AbrB family looped-hinge helix DNA binding protein
MAGRAKTTGFEEGKQPSLERDPPFAQGARILRETIKLGEGGRLVIPSAMREALAIRPGDNVALECQDGVLKLRSYAAVVKDLQDEIKAMVPPGRKVVDEFLSERREDQVRADARLERLHREAGSTRE